ncbi:pentatricopeptide repeat-containing protein At2g20540-like [Triticum dicoccoides]|uniref:pentatricopeptide repeat-containing protein At2g20540-like n=1 Tax=Triticum dicoccoides TaxID=85692 RepID=UPI00188DDD74|nr:pentatricopeptide repeat-containing protein At2g20540-like [Triticum dicoccoides]
MAAAPSTAARQVEDAVMARLRACATFRDLLRVHAHVVQLSLSQSSYIATQIIQLCNAHGRTAHAARVFDQVREPNLHLHNAMIKAYAQNHLHREAVAVYIRMLRCRPFPSTACAAGDRFTYPFLLKACGGLAALGLGKQVHAHVVRSGCECNAVVQNSMIEMYTRAGDLSLARKVFDGMQERDAVTWNTVISAHARLGQMRKARALFNSMPEKTIVSWTALVSGYTIAGDFSGAVEAFQSMQMEGFEPDDVSIVAVLPACAQLGALELGRWIYAYCNRHRMLRETYVCNALMEMYARCGCIDQALQLFDGMEEKDVISWSTMINGLAAHGRAKEAVLLFVDMEREGKVRPNGITFVGLLSACSHAGLLDEGLNYFDRMKEVYGIEPGVEHYGCVVDLLGRSGQIVRALNLIVDMPVPADAKIWGSMLSACRSHGDVDTAVVAAERLVALEPDDVGNLVMLANVYAAARQWSEVASTRKTIRSRSMKKTPGCSLIEVDNVVQEFVAGEDLKPEFGGLVGVLDILASQLAEEGVDFIDPGCFVDVNMSTIDRC